MSPLDTLRRRFAAMPLDRAPLRRAGLLTVLLVVLIGAMQAMGPARPERSARHAVQATPETSSASADPASADPASADPASAGPRPAPRRSGWGAGRVLALVLLVGGGGAAVVLRRRAAPAEARRAVLEVLETHPLGPGQALRLVACGDEVLLLAATSEGVRMLRHWPRDAVDRGHTSRTFGSPGVDLAAGSARAGTPAADAEARPAALGVLFPPPAAPAGGAPVQFGEAPAAPAPAAFADVLRQFQVGHV